MSDVMEVINSPDLQDELTGLISTMGLKNGLEAFGWNGFHLFKVKAKDPKLQTKIDEAQEAYREMNRSEAAEMARTNVRELQADRDNMEVSDKIRLTMLQNKISQKPRDINAQILNQQTNVQITVSDIDTSKLDKLSAGEVDELLDVIEMKENDNGEFEPESSD